MKQTMTMDELADTLRLHPTTLRGKLGKLVSDHGFPPRLPGCSVFSTPAVLRWIQTNGNTYLSEAGDDPVETARDDIETRYGGGRSNVQNP